MSTEAVAAVEERNHIALIERFGAGVTEVCGNTVEGTSTARRSRAVVLLDIIGRDGSCGLIGNGKVIRQHCPKIAPGEANRHLP